MRRYEAKDRNSIAEPVHVLHVTESLGAGVESAIRAYVEATPEIRHHLLAARRGGAHDDQTADVFESRSVLSRSVRGYGQIREQMALLQPTVVHLHSSWAGFLGGFPLPRGPRIVYSPHCFSFNRRDVNSVARKSFLAVEKVLRTRRDVLAACSAHEAEIAERMGFSRVVIVPNVASIKSEPSTDFALAPKRRLVMAGRIGVQKAPEYFADVYRDLRRADPSWVATWIGDGDTLLRRGLEAAGIEVTGWQKPEGVAERLRDGGVFLHSARWEGYPVAVIDAVNSGLPVLTRRIACFRDSWDFSSAESPQGLSKMAQRLAASREYAVENVRGWRRVLALNTVAEQRRSLMDCYGS